MMTGDFSFIAADGKKAELKSVKITLHAGPALEWRCDGETWMFAQFVGVELLDYPLALVKPLKDGSWIWSAAQRSDVAPDLTTAKAAAEAALKVT